MGDSVGEKIKASGKTVLTGEKEESRVGGRGGEVPTGRAIRLVVGGGVKKWMGGGWWVSAHCWPP